MSAAPDATAIRSTPLRIVSRSESAEKRCGRYESVAMLAMTRGPSRKPACAATKRSAPSETSAVITNVGPKGMPANVQPQLGHVGAERDEEEDRVRQEEERKDRGDGRDRLLHAAQVHDREEEEAAARERHLVRMERGGDEAEDRVGAGRDRRRDGQDIVDQ